MKKLILAMAAAGLSVPAVALVQGNSGDKRQDVGFPFETRGECERAAQRSNSAARKNGETVRYECVEEDGMFEVRTVSDGSSG